MIERYTLAEMAEIWSEEHKLRTWLRVELTIVEALAIEGIVPADSARRISESASLSPNRVREIEGVIDHDVLAFVESVCETLGEDSGYFHMGVTSSDILDTSLALLIVEATRLITDELGQLRQTLGRLAAEHKDTMIVGRTHGMHAEPTSLGLKFGVWFNEIGRAISRIERAGDELRVGKVSGAVGNYSHLSPEIEDTVLGSLGLRPERPATQIVQRDRHASYVSSLALAAGSMERIAVELRNLQRTEIAEAEEPFAPGQKGSSSMPHKRNPITLERICGLARLVRSHAVPAMENIALWHERDISHSSAERVILPDSTILVHYMARSLRNILEGVRLDTARMRHNIDATRGLIYSQRLMLGLIKAGWGRKSAYEKVQQLAETAKSMDRDLSEVVKEDEEIRQIIGSRMLDELFDPHFYIRYAHRILRDTGIA